jgi:hypothetical protein
VERGKGPALQIRKVIDPTAADAVVLDVLPHPLSRFATVRGSLDNRV